MRISDWSSDVCSSDLIAGTVIGIEADNTELVKQGQTLVKLDPTDTRVALRQAEAAQAQAVRHTRTIFVKNDALKSDIAMRQANIETARVDLAKAKSDLKRRRTLAKSGGVSGERSEEHTSELQSLMRISYDVFCLKKKKSGHFDLLITTYLYEK